MNPLRSPQLCRLLVLFVAGLGLCLADAKGQQAGKDKAAPAAGAKSDGTLPDNVVKSLTWRSVGPANMAGRITAISVFEADSSCYWVATASGGLLKTVNNGTTFEHQFDKENTVSIGDVCVAPSDRNIVWVGTGEGNPRNSVSYGDGVYKSVDGGKTWKHMGLKETFQIGKILVHPTNPDIVYVGALGRCYGPNKERGLYKTTDGGKTWDKILFKDDKTGIIDMAMDPTNPDRILVAMYERKRDGFDAHLAKEWPEPYDWYDPIVRFGEHAGIYRTNDGGKTFDRIMDGLPPSKNGRIGLSWGRKDPKVVYAIIDCEDIGKGPAPKKAAGAKGFAGFVGEDSEAGYRILNILQDSPASKVKLMVGDIITALNDKAIKTQADYDAKIGEFSAGDKVTLGVKRNADVSKVELTLAELPQKGGKGGGFGGGGKGASKDRPFLVDLGGQNPNMQDQQGPDGWKYGGIYRSADSGKTWKRINSLNDRPMYFSVVRVDPSDDKYVYSLGVNQYKSSDGGKTFAASAGKGVHSDGHALWIDPKDGRHMLIGCDGGYYVSYDRASTWDHLNNMAIGQFYHVAISLKQPYWLFGGLQDNGSWGLPSVGLQGHGPINEDVVSVGGGDGFVCQVDANDPDLVYTESQGGAMSRRNLRTGEKGNIRPGLKGGGKGGGMGGGGGKGGGMGKGPEYRFNWNTPMVLSHFNSKIFYCAGDYVFKSLDRGDDLKIISPQITLTKLGSGTAFSESPKNPDVLWVGTDDGALWLTKNGGKDWTELSANLPMRGKRWVATIEASRYQEGRCYVCFDAHRSDDDEPYIFVTEDFGEKWTPLRNNLPGFGSTRCLREDVENENLLFCGTEFNLYASINRGSTWSKINNNLPTVAIHEVAIHPTVGEIAVATHGRSLWIMDASALRQMKPDVLAKPVVLFKPPTTTRWQTLVTTGGTNRRFEGTNPAPGAPIYYYLGEDAKKVTMKVMDVNGELISTITDTGAGFGGKKGGFGGGGGGGGGGFGGKGGMGGGGGQPLSTKQGLHAVRWNMMKQAADGAGGKGGKGGGGKGGGGFGGFGGAAFNGVAPGAYKVVLNVDGQEHSTTVRIEADPNIPVRPGAGGEEEPFIDPRKIR